MTARVLTLITAAAAFWLAAGLPARYLGGGDEALVFSGVAVLLALVPGILVLVWVGLSSSLTPQQQTLAILGGTGVRMFAALLIAYVLHQNVDFFRRPAFLLWVGAAYMFLLAVEVVLLVRAQQEQQKSAGA